MIIVLMGVSGVGKTTVGKRLAQRLEIPFHEGDDFHSPDNIAKMERGEPLNERDRTPWIESLQNCIETLLANGQQAVIACSALKADYRQQLGGGHDRVEFVLLKGSRALIQERLNQREDHFMAASLLNSQMEALEAPADSLVVEVDKTPEAIVESIVDGLDLAQP
ncbi:gluconokinase [Nodosilinea sp. PGN35]|uniref:gluconokinase n=1 Tax=Nodosilinea sp. PGN35 TaxID=3020489 RepID=UPI0023B20E3F|nr:gluconokinase [Nodosilinea sp. TSF1-S3]MDF0370136.1 gluconokinase [Nodosilinea sp. TSF1-S3]